LDWTETGSSPYLSAIDAPTNHVSTITGSLKREGIWDFPNSGAENTETLNNVYVEVYARGVNDPDLGYATLTIYVSDGSTFTSYSKSINSASWTWFTVDVSAKITTWAKLDACRVYFRASTSLTQYIDVDCLRLQAVSTPAIQWHDIATWTFNLQTREWSSITSWDFDILAREWLEIATLNFNAHGREWIGIMNTTVFDGLLADAYMWADEPVFLDAWNATTAENIVDNEQLWLRCAKVFSLYDIMRAYLYFNTSILPSNAIILEANLTLYCISKNSDNNITIQNGQPTYPHNILELSDFWQGHYSGDGGTITASEITTQEFFTIQFTDDGETWINKGNLTKLCLRMSDDINAIAPTTGTNHFVLASKDYDITYNDTICPKLTVRWKLLYQEWLFDIVTLGWHTINYWIFTLPSMVWHSILSWNFDLITRLWQTIKTISFSLISRIWQDIIQWTLNMVAVTWHDVALWIFDFPTMSWKTIVAWTFNLVGVGWHMIAYWILHLDLSVTNIAVLFIGVAFFASIIGLILIVRRRRR
jgi:hypothetical protein